MLADPLYFAGPDSLLHTAAPILVQGITLVVRFLALAWVVGRSYRILKQSVAEWQDVLNPHAGSKLALAVQNVGKNSLVVNWQYQVGTKSRRAPKLRCFLVCVGGKQLVMDKDDKHAVLEGLQSDEVYEVSVHALCEVVETVPGVGPNSNGASAASFSSTNYSNGRNGNGGGGGNNGSANFTTSAAAVAEEDCMVSASATIFARTLGDSVKIPSLELMRASIPPQVYENSDNYNPEILRVQQEICDLVMQETAAQQQIYDRNKELSVELASLNELRRADEAARTQLRAENHSLEQELHLLEVQGAKLVAQASQIARHTSEQQNEVAQLRDLEEQKSVRERASELRLQQLSKELEQLQHSEAQLQTQTSESSDRLKVTNHRVQQVRNMVNTVKEETSIESRLQVLEAMMKSKDSSDALSEYGEVIQRLLHELQLDATIEREWRRAQYALEQSYIQTYYSRYHILPSSVPHMPKSSRKPFSPSTLPRGPSSLTQQGVPQQGVPQPSIPQPSVPPQTLPQQALPQQAVPQQGTVPQPGIAAPGMVNLSANPVAPSNVLQPSPVMMPFPPSHSRSSSSSLSVPSVQSSASSLATAPQPPLPPAPPSFISAFSGGPAFGGPFTSSAAPTLYSPPSRSSLNSSVSISSKQEIPSISYDPFMVSLHPQSSPSSYNHLSNEKREVRHASNPFLNRPVDPQLRTPSMSSASLRSNGASPPDNQASLNTPGAYTPTVFTQTAPTSAEATADGNTVITNGPIEMPDGPEVSTPKSKRDWLPWIGAHKTPQAQGHPNDASADPSSGSRRTQSLFFHGNSQQTDEDAIDESEYNGSLHGPITGSPTNRSPRRSMVRLFNRSGGGRTSSFASRFGFFSKKGEDDTEPSSA